MTKLGPIEDLEAWTAERVEHLDGRPVVVSVSGGKDSTALCLLLKAAGIPFRCVHMDTGWEHPDTESYVRDYLPGIVGPIEVLRSEKYDGMADLIRKRGMFPGRVARFCTQELKVFPFRAWLKEQDDEPVNAIGIRAAESRARSQLEEWDWSAGFDIEVWRPLIRWAEQDVIDIHGEFGVQPNPLYLRGAERVGCWPCIYARKDEIGLVARESEWRIEEIEQLETEVQESARKRYEARGETFESLGYQPPTFFNKSHRGLLPIRQAVEWSKTERGGQQLSMFLPPRDEGCMRWGLCDTGGEVKGEGGSCD